MQNMKQFAKNIFKTRKLQIRYQSVQKAAEGPVLLSHNILEPRSVTEPLGPPLMILHGPMASKQNWRQISKQIYNGLNHARKVLFALSFNLNCIFFVTLLRRDI